MEVRSIRVLSHMTFSKLTKTALFSLAVVIVSIGLAITINFVVAWQGPSGDPPPSGNVSQPINTGSDSQTKQGALIIEGASALFKGLQVGSSSLQLTGDNENLIYGQVRGDTYAVSNLFLLEKGEDEVLKIGGDYSFAAGRNSTAGANSAIAMGFENRAAAPSSAVIGGANNNSNGSNSIILGGIGNTAAGQYSTVVGGSYNTSTSTGNNSLILGGTNNTAKGATSVVIGGGSSEAAGQGSAVIGTFAKATGPYSFVLGRGEDFSSPLINNITDSLMIGFNSQTPMLTVTEDKVCLNDPDSNSDGLIDDTADCISSWSEVGGATADFCSTAPKLSSLASASDGNLGGYSGGNTLCDEADPGSHLCTTSEILNSINCGTDISSVIITDAWVSGGIPLPSQTSALNDCFGWTRNSAADLGINWLNDNGTFYTVATTCSSSHVLACCK